MVTPGGPSSLSLRDRQYWVFGVARLVYEDFPEVIA